MSTLAAVHVATKTGKRKRATSTKSKSKPKSFSVGDETRAKKMRKVDTDRMYDLRVLPRHRYFM